MPLLLIGLFALAGLATWEIMKNNAPTWQLLSAGATMAPGNYRISITVPAGQAASAPTMAPILAQALQTVGWTNVSTYLPGGKFPSDWPDSRRRKSRSMPAPIRATATAPPRTAAAKLWVRQTMERPT